MQPQIYNFYRVVVLFFAIFFQKISNFNKFTAKIRILY